jgi:hypothetical protein
MRSSHYRVPDRRVVVGDVINQDAIGNEIGGFRKVKGVESSLWVYALFCTHHYLIIDPSDG